MTLLDRLHPVYKDKLSKANLQYPDLIGNLTDELETTEFVTDLRFGTIMDLRCLCGWTQSPFDYFTEQLFIMTHYEDVKRAATPSHIDYLNARIEALEKRVMYLEAVIEVEILNEEE